MVCPRCIFVAQNELAQLGASITTIRLGFASIQVPEHITKHMIASRLNEYGLELLEEKEDILIERIKLGVQRYIQALEKTVKNDTLSECLAQEIGKNYNFLSKLFSKHEGQTIETYYIHKRIDRVKELIQYEELNLSEIAMNLRYSSVHYLSTQFKRVTGISVSEYKAKLRNKYLHYKNISEALTHLREQGYTYSFDKKNGCLECKDLCVSFRIEDLNISEFYRFNESVDSAGNSIIYGIETPGGLKGLFIDSNSASSKWLLNQLTENAKASEGLKKNG